jgi:hypothetical protein
MSAGTVKRFLGPNLYTFIHSFVRPEEPRVIAEGAHMHESVVRRMEQDPTPVNLPTTFATVPMPVPPHAKDTAEAG